MKNLVKKAGVLFTLIIIGAIFISCDEIKNALPNVPPEEEILFNNLPALTGKVSILGIAEVGETLTADTDNLGGDGWIEYYWESHGHTVSYDSTYTVQENDIGSTITVTVTRSENSGSVKSEPTGIITTPGLAFTSIKNGTAYSVFKGTAKGAVIVIPAIHNNLPVIEIADSAFINYTDLTNIIIPTGVTRIGDYAFFHCSNLTSVVIPSGITNIGNFAFQDCSSLSMVFFGGNNNLEWTEITIGSNNNQLTSASMYYYSTVNKGFVDTYWRFLDGEPSVWAVLSFLLIDNNTAYSVSIGYENGSEDTEFIIIPATYNGLPVTEIANFAFYNSSTLKNIIIPDSIINIGYDAFSGCKSMMSINVDVNNLNFASQDGILFNKQKTQLIYCPQSISGNITIPDSVTSIGSSAFYDCTSLTSITIPNSVTSIGNRAFWGCTNLSITWNYNSLLTASELRNYLKTAVISDKVTSIGNRAFYDCTKLTNITIPDSVTSIGNYAFYNCASLTSVTIPNSVTSIGNYAFMYCTNLSITWNYNSLLTASELRNYLKTAVISDKVTSIGDYAFYGCTSLTSITIPDSVSSIGDRAFYGCTGLTSITIPDSVTSIGSGAFSECLNLSITYYFNPSFSGDSSYIKTVIISDSVTSIDRRFNNGFSNLTSFIVDINNPNYTSQNGILYNKEKTQLIVYPRGISGNITIPDSVTSIGDRAFYGCTGLTSITIPDNVTSIGDYAFYGCTGLTSIIIPSSVTSIGEFMIQSCMNLTNLIIQRATPDITTIDRPNNSGVGGLSFYDYVLNSNLRIEVPVGSVDTYKTSSSWRYYSSKIHAIGCNTNCEGICK
ncbi:MAG: leucine-rich repeat domain-containing protein [Treponema sp.]|nr:leucine-rich repeat domain-containing protein [Treponema sp.]MCL2252426.1 leucine-rich repeat domain-containing protein [Treponema sp.]